ncbi:MAG: hypothetical protein E7162_01570 [Firmicutes bacterium]|nr:hypothetical protein [Bacillota bacterium]
MNKKLKLLLLTFIFIPVFVYANDSYVNYYGIEMNETEYSNLLGLGFTEEEIYHMEEEEFNANKNIESSLEATTTKYYVETVRYDSTGRVVHSNTSEVTEEEYNDDMILNMRSTATTETTYKKMVTTIAQAGTKYRYKVTLTWKQLPKVRSYDIIGIGIEPSLVSITSDVVFNQTYCISNSCTNTNSYYTDSYHTTGAGVSFKLASNSGITGLRSYFYYDVSKKNSNQTLNYQYADGDYSHATSTITASLSEWYYVNQTGIVLYDNISGYYDAISSAEAEWSGTW